MPTVSENRDRAWSRSRLLVLTESLAELVEGEHGPFDVDDVILFGKYKNKRGRIISFGVNHKGQVTIEVEPIPKGRKKNKILGLYKIWTMPQPEPEPQPELESVQRLREYGPPDEWSGSVAAFLGSEGRRELQQTWDGLTKAEQTKVRQEWDEGWENEAAPRRVRRRKAGSGQRKMTKICPKGMNMMGGRCIRVQAGKRAKTRRMKKRWGRTGGATKSKRKSSRMRRRYGSIETLGNLIAEGRTLLDNHDPT